jgi:hypothetical protein
MFPYARHFAAGVVLAVILGTGTARAARPSDRAGFETPAAGSRLEPGPTIRVAWQEPETRGSEKEMELVLSLDGGRTFPVRLSRDLPIRSGGLILRVPVFRSRRARLGLRAGDDDDPAAEHIVCESGDFAIEAVGEIAAGEFETLSSVRGEWRTDEALDGARPVPLAGFSPPSEGSVSAAVHSAELAGPRPIPVIAIARADVAPRAPASRDDPAETARESRLTPPSVPLRL